MPATWWTSNGHHCSALKTRSFRRWRADFMLKTGGYRTGKPSGCCNGFRNIALTSKDLSL